MSAPPSGDPPAPVPPPQSEASAQPEYMPSAPGSATGDLPPDALDFATRCFDAARNGDAEWLLAAIDAGLPVGLTSAKGGNDLLMLAAYHGHAALTAGLLQRGAEPNKVNDRGQTPLSGAVFKNEDAVVRALLDGGADPRQGTPTAIDAARMFKQEHFLDMFGATAAPGLGPPGSTERPGR